MQSPVFQECKDTDWAVVFIHGFMGGPNQFTGLAKAVGKIGCTQLSLLLPGHGSSVADFVRFGADDWQRHVQGEIEKIRDDYKKIFLIGHSMGGLLALHASLIKENNIAGVVLLATPLKVQLIHPKSFSRKLRLLLLPNSHEVKSEYRRSNSIVYSKGFFYPFLAKPTAAFYKLMRQTKKYLPEVFVPVCMFHSKNDETTSYKSAALLHRGLSNTEKTAFSLDKSCHAFYTDEEQAFIEEKVLAFIQSQL